MRLQAYAALLVFSAGFLGCSAADPAAPTTEQGGGGGSSQTGSTGGGGGASNNASGGSQNIAGEQNSAGSQNTVGTNEAGGAQNIGGSQDTGDGQSTGGAPDASADAKSPTPDAGLAPSDGSVDHIAIDAGPADPQAIDVYLIGGQSNATGQGYTKNLPTGFAPNPKVLLYASGAPHLNSGKPADTWMPLQQASESPDRFGPELGFGNTIQSLYPSRKIAIIKHANSATSLYSDWAPGSSATDTSHFGPQFQVFVDTVTGGLQGLKNQGYHPTIRGMLWQQGENDADRGGAISMQYGQNLVAFIKRVRAQWSTPGMLFIYGYVYPPPNTGTGRDEVRQNEGYVDQDSGNALATTGAFVVLTDDLEQRADDPGTPLPNDHVHFGSAGQLELGKRMATKMADKQVLP